MIRVDILIYGATIFAVLVVAMAVYAQEEPNRGCIASAYQAEMRGFDLQENLEACYGQ